MTIIVVGNNSYTTSLEPTEQDEHNIDEHDADPTTDVHDHIGNFKVTGSLTVDDTILTDGIQAGQGYFVDDNSGIDVNTSKDWKKLEDIFEKQNND